jgi:YD repeat-containing protein
MEAFAYLAFYLRLRQPSGERLLDDPAWQLFFLFRQAVEHFFFEAHQQHLLEYHAAGSIIRITFPARTMEEYAYALAQRAH